MLARLAPPADLRFFTPDARRRRCARFCDMVMAQDAEPRIPVLEMVDEKLPPASSTATATPTCPTTADTWRLRLRGLDAHRATRLPTRVRRARPSASRRALDRRSSQDLPVGEPWDELPVARAWWVVMRAVLAAFYSHPWAWNEIGFGGPAYPRGYMRLGSRPGAARAAASRSTRDPVPFGERGRAGPASARTRLRGALKGRALGPAPTTTRPLLLDVTAADPRLRATMRRYADDDEVDLVIVGAGAGGASLAQRLARPAGGS